MNLFFWTLSMIWIWCVRNRILIDRSAFFSLWRVSLTRQKMDYWRDECTYSWARWRKFWRCFQFSTWLDSRASSEYAQRRWRIFRFVGLSRWITATAAAQQHGQQLKRFSRVSHTAHSTNCVNVKQINFYRLLKIHNEAFQVSVMI